MTSLASVRDTWPFLDRERELDTIVRAYRERGGGVVLVGAGGVGRTRLAREALARIGSAARIDSVTQWVAATRAGATIEFGALAHLLPEDERLDGGRLTILRWLARRFHDAGEPRAVLVVDDAHLLDDASAAFVHHLATHGAVFLIVTRRACATASDAITALEKEGLVTRVDLGPLPAARVAELLDDRFGRQLDAVSRRDLARLGAGNPLMVRALLQALLETGELRRVHGIWRWSGDLTVTTRLAETVEEQIGAVGERVRTALEAVACAEPLPVMVLERLVADEHALAASEKSGLLSVEPAPGPSSDRLVVRLAHPLYGVVIRATLPAARARALWVRLAEELPAAVMLGGGALPYRAGRPLGADVPVPPEGLLAAARTAMARFDHAPAERLARAACARGGGSPAGQLLAEILTHQGRYDEAAEVLPHPPLSDDPPERDAAAPGGPAPAGGSARSGGPAMPGGAAAVARWAITWASISYWGRSDVAATEQALAQAAACGRAAEANAVRSWMLLFEGHREESLQAGTPILRSPDASPEALVRAAACVTAAAGLGGRLDGAEAAYRQGLAVARRHERDLPGGGAPIGFAYCLALLANGHLHEACLLIDREHRAALAGQPAAVVGGWTAWRGAVAKAQGRLEVATRALREAAALLDGHDVFRMSHLCLAELAGAAALTEDTGGASAWLSRADQDTAPASSLFRPWVELNRAWTMAADGDTSQGAAHARHAAEIARSTGQPTIEAIALYDATRLGDARSVRRRLAVLAGELGTPVATAMASAATGLVDREAGPLETAAGVFQRLGLWLHAAEAETAAARTHRQAGRRIQANRSMERAAVLRSHCSQARTPLLDTTELADILTRREREVVLLAAASRPSREIAFRLGLSVRTVDNYLCRAYAKLGVSGRTELADLLAR